MIKFKSLRTRIWCIFSIIIITIVIITSSILFILIESFEESIIDNKIIINEMTLNNNHSIEYNRLLNRSISIIIILIVIGFFISKLIADYISKPLKELEEYSSKISKKEWTPAIEVRNDDEIGSLIKAMNEMQIQLKRSDEEEKLFLQSISHDLKTPVMVIMSHAEAIIDGVYIESLDETARVIKDESIRLDKKIKKILYFNSLNYMLDYEQNTSQINLKELINNIVKKLNPLKNTIEFFINDEDVFVEVNKDNISVCIENIIENALRYAKSEIIISLSKEGGNNIIEIFNDGPNIKVEEIDKIFDTFYKGKKGSFGLGLSISKKIIKHYGGNIFVENKPNGISFVIQL